MASESEATRPTVVGLPSVELVELRDDGPSAGATIGRFVVVEEAGVGGMGVVLRAYDPRLRREVALKRLRGSTDNGGARLLREARAMAQLAHPNVLAVYDVEEIDDDAFVVMEYVEGATLKDWLRARSRDRDEILEVFAAAAQGLAAAHGVGLVHRDFKPSNVLVGHDGRVRVMDFGLARALDEDVSSSGAGLRSSSHDSWDEMLTAEGMVLGTPAYMAPEQHQGRTADARADQYAWCVALWEAIVGDRPFGGSPRDLIDAKRAGPPPWPAGADPVWLGRVLVRGLAPRPEDRFATMRELSTAIAAGQRRTHRRRIVVATAAVGLLGLSTYGVHAFAVHRRTAACDRAGASIAEVWSDATWSAVPSDDEGAVRARPRLDTYAADWQRARTEACIAADTERDADTVDRALWCLDEARMELAAIVTELGHGDPAALRNAVTSALDLPPVANCRDAVLLARLPAPPIDRRDEVRSARADLSRAKALWRAGRLDEGITLAEQTRVRADEIAWPPLSARTGLVLGGLLAQKGRLAEAEPVLEEAYFTAAEANVASIAVDAADELVFLVGSALARPTEGLRWARHAEVALAATGEGDGPRLARHYNELALVHRAMRHLDDARALHEQALAIRSLSLGADHPDVAQSLHNLAFVQFQAGDPAAALELLERALAIRERAFGADHPDVAVTLNNIAGVHHELGHLDLALPLYERTLAIWQRVLGPDNKDVAAVMGNIAGVHVGAGQPERAVPMLERSLAITEAVVGPEHPDVGSSLHNLGLALRLAGRLAQARPLQERSLQILERAFGPDDPEITGALLELAAIALEDRRPADAIAFCRRALELRMRAHAPPPAIAEVQFLMARALRDPEIANAIR